MHFLIAARDRVNNKTGTESIMEKYRSSRICTSISMGWLVYVETLLGSMLCTEYLCTAFVIAHSALMIILVTN